MKGVLPLVMALAIGLCLVQTVAAAMAITIVTNIVRMVRMVFLIFVLNTLVTRHVTVGRTGNVAVKHVPAYLPFKRMHISNEHDSVNLLNSVV